MSKTQKILVMFLAFDAVIAGFYFGIKAISSSSGKALTSANDWRTMDESYQPVDYVEQFIKDDASEKGIFPVQIRNYGRNIDVLKRFRGKNFARSSESSLNLAFPGLDDWTIIDIKYKNEKDQEVLRTVLYVQVEGDWRVGDSGSLPK